MIYNSVPILNIDQLVGLRVAIILQQISVAFGNLSKWKLIEMEMYIMWNKAGRVTKQAGLLFWILASCLLSLIHLTTQHISFFPYLSAPFILLCDDIFWNTNINHWTYEVNELDVSTGWDHGTYSLNMLWIKHPDYNWCWKCCQLFCTPICHLY